MEKGTADAAKNIAKAIDTMAKNEDASVEKILSSAGVNTKKFYELTNSFLGVLANDLGETLTGFLDIKGEELNADLNAVSVRVNATKVITPENVAQLSDSFESNLVKPTRKSLSKSKAWIAAVVIILLAVIAGVAVAGYFMYKKKIWIFAEKEESDGHNEVTLTLA